MHHGDLRLSGGFVLRAAPGLPDRWLHLLRTASDSPRGSQHCEDVTGREPSNSGHRHPRALGAPQSPRSRYDEDRRDRERPRRCQSSDGFTSSQKLIQFNSTCIYLLGGDTPIIGASA